MEPILLTCMVIAFLITKSKVDTTAYANGKEPPGLAKARLAHERGGGKRAASGRPKGPGALRLLLASQWANACAAAKQRGDHIAARRRAWYEETAPLRDEEWRKKHWQRLLDNDARRNLWATHRGLSVADTADSHLDKADKAAEAGTDAKADTSDSGNEKAKATDSPTQTAKPDAESATAQAKPHIAATEAKDTSPDATPADHKPAEQQATDRPSASTPPAAADSVAAQPAAATDEDTAVSTTTKGNTEMTVVYMKAVDQLVAAADQAEAFRSNLTAFADGLAGKGWGVEVTGPLQDMDSQLATLAGHYRDLAGQMKSQGDRGAEAYDQAPYVPGPEAVLA
jgi:chemotaxis protein histidine kinase CheA